MNSGFLIEFLQAGEITSSGKISIRQNFFYTIKNLQL